MKYGKMEKFNFLTDKRLSTVKFINSKIIKIIQNLNPYKVHGHVKINIRMLKICGNSLCRPLELKRIFNDCLANGIFPFDWKKGNMVPVPKEK